MEHLKDKTDLRPYLGHIDLFVMHRHAIDNEFAFLDGLQAVYTTNQGTLARTTDSGHETQDAKGELDGNVLQVVSSCTGESHCPVLIAAPAAAQAAPVQAGGNAAQSNG